MSEQKRDDGGPAFPATVTEYNTSSEQREVTHIGGMSLRDYFIAHAPAVPQPWFQPAMPPRPEPKWMSNDRKTTFFNWQAAEIECGVDGYINDTDKDAVEWEREKAKQLFIQWPSAWADAQLALRKIANGAGAGDVSA